MPGELYSGLKWGLKGEEVIEVAGSKIDGAKVYVLGEENDPYAYSYGVLSYASGKGHPMSDVNLYNSDELMSKVLEMLRELKIAMKNCGFVHFLSRSQKQTNQSVI